MIELGLKVDFEDNTYRRLQFHENEDYETQPLQTGIETRQRPLGILETFYTLIVGKGNVKVGKLKGKKQKDVNHHTKILGAISVDFFLESVLDLFSVQCMIRHSDGSMNAGIRFLDSIKTRESTFTFHDTICNNACKQC